MSAAGDLQCSSPKDAPERMKHRAVFAFIVAVLVKPVLKTAMSNFQPASTRKPAAIAPAAALREINLRIGKR
ncbi:MAG: hypothetical protein HC849_30860 [Oscillatoriales cyanobacterium RU_3_3]|nr:hypothetical protein [Oscillatoriales cyanobacterium RU_3_3]